MCHIHTDWDKSYSMSSLNATSYYTSCNSTYRSTARQHHYDFQLSILSVRTFCFCRLPWLNNEPYVVSSVQLLQCFRYSATLLFSALFLQIQIGGERLSKPPTRDICHLITSGQRQILHTSGTKYSNSKQRLNTTPCRTYDNNTCMSSDLQHPSDRRRSDTLPSSVLRSFVFSLV